MILLEKIIFACPWSGTSGETLILARSIREFAGSLSDSSIWVFTSKSLEEFPKEAKNELMDLKAEIIQIDGDPEDLKFPFVGFVLAAATAESMAKGKTEYLVWIDSNSMIIKEPKKFLLKEGKNIGYRPVHHTLIGSIYDEPIDSFWRLIYQKCNVQNEKIFPMKTHVDGKILRPYVNSGFMSVRPEKGLFQLWWDIYKKLYKDPDFQRYYDKDGLYVTFIHQAVLAGIILSTMGKGELYELPFEYNYPIHLYPESPKEYQPESINDMVTIRLYLDKLKDPKWREQIPINDPLKSWIEKQLVHTLTDKEPISDKVKFGQIPLVYPIPIVLTGALVDGKANFEELGDVAVMGIKPAIICISSGKDNHTNKGILEHGTFSINFPTTKMIAETDYCGTVSGKDVDKSQLFDIFYGELETAPMIKECPVNLECKVIKEFLVEHRQIFIADVIQAHVSKEYVTEENGRKKIAEMTKLDPIIYALDNKYYKIGEPIGEGYKESKKLKK